MLQRLFGVSIVIVAVVIPWAVGFLAIAMLMLTGDFHISWE